jgi:hypothetical protein
LELKRTITGSPPNRCAAISAAPALGDEPTTLSRRVSPRHFCQCRMPHLGD